MKKHLSQELSAGYDEVLKMLDPKLLQEYKVTEFLDHYIPHPYDSVSTQYAYEEWEPRSSDILIASFPKTGTTWTREILRQILYWDNPENMEISKDFAIPFLYLEGGGVMKYKIMDNIPITRRYFATHLGPDALNMKKLRKVNVKILLLSRNPKDQLLSYYNYVKGFPFKPFCIDHTPFSLEWPKFFTQATSGMHAVCVRRGEWFFEFLNDWFQEAECNKNILHVSYEKMTQNPAHEIARISTHIGKKIDDEHLSQVVSNTSVDAMKKQVENPGFDKIFRTKFNLVYKGGIGKWKSYFTVSQSEEMDKMVQERVKCNIDFIYE